MPGADDALLALARAIAAGDVDGASRKVHESPELATAALAHGATRDDAETFYLRGIEHYVYAGDTALHVASAAFQCVLLERLIELGADVSARNRRGAQPLHYACDGIPGSEAWNPDGQAAVIAALIAAGADPDAVDTRGVAPLHRAVRTRCSAAVRALLDGGADANVVNRAGSTPMDLARATTGRGGSGGAEAKAEQAAIVDLLTAHGASA